MKSTVLVCLPFAGAGASFFRKWHPLQPEQLTLLPVQLPGREERFADPFPTDVDEAVEELRPWVLRQIRDAERTAVFGHSFGAALAYELARRLADDGVTVSRLFVSGAPGPRDRRVERLSALDDAAFLDGLRRAAGYRHPAMDHPEMLEIMMPALRADAALHENYQSAHTEPADFPITSLRGRDDSLVSAAQTAQWARETKAAFNAVELDGRHMYLTEHADSLLRTIAREIEERQAVAEGQHTTAAEDARDPATAPVPHGDPTRWLTLVHTLWREVLGVQDIGDDVNFYAAGGDSMLLITLVERLRQETGRQVRTKDLLSAGTVRRQADLLATTAGR